MKVNNNPHHVIMSREMYDELMNRATWEGSNANHIRWHVRKFNSDLAKERKAELVIRDAAFKETKQKVREFVEECRGKLVYYRVKRPNGWAYIAATPRCIGVGKLTVACLDVDTPDYKNHPNKKQKLKQHRLENLFTVVPDGSVPLPNGCYFKGDKDE